MPMTHDLGRLFVHKVALESDSPRLHTAVTTEIEEPYRRSNSLVVRLFAEFGVVIGWWKQDPNRTEDEALLTALSLGAHGGHEYDEEDTLALLDPGSTDENRPEGEEPAGGVGSPGDAWTPVKIYL